MARSVARRPGLRPVGVPAGLAQPLAEAQEGRHRPAGVAGPGDKRFDEKARPGRGVRVEVGAGLHRAVQGVVLQDRCEGVVVAGGQPVGHHRGVGGRVVAQLLESVVVGEGELEGRQVAGRGNPGQVPLVEDPNRDGQRLSHGPGRDLLRDPKVPIVGVVGVQVRRVAGVPRRAVVLVEDREAEPQPLGGAEHPEQRAGMDVVREVGALLGVDPEVVQRCADRAGVIAVDVGAQHGPVGGPGARRADRQHAGGDDQHQADQQPLADPGVEAARRPIEPGTSQRRPHHRNDPEGAALEHQRGGLARPREQDDEEGDECGRERQPRPRRGEGQ